MGVIVDRRDWWDDLSLDQRRACYELECAAWHERQKLIKKKTKDYYAGGFKVMLDGVPIKMFQDFSPHALAVIRNNETMLVLMANACIRHPQTTYDPVADFQTPQKK